MPPALLTAVDCTRHVHLVIGTNPLAGARCAKSLEAGAVVKLIASADATLHYGLMKRIEDGQVEWLRRVFEDSDLETLGREEVAFVVDTVFITLGARHALSMWMPCCSIRPRQAKTFAGNHISTLCRRLRIPVNVADAPNLSTFTLLSMHTDGPLQIGVTTSGKGCKLAARIRREIASSLPQGLGKAVERLGTMRRRIWEEDHAAELAMDVEIEDEDIGQNANFNRLITPEDAEAARMRRMRWLAQICEYWPLQRLASITGDDVELVLRSYSSSGQSGLDIKEIDGRKRKGRIILAGSGPGNPDLLTLATHKAILSADLVLADKLVPSQVMDLIPRRAQVHIARKFPGNADRAQEELLELGLEGLKAGENVIRLKQGDPYIYGRGAEEYDFFRSHGYIPLVLPGITSALSAPLFACIPPTHRGIADEVLICTGTGRKGAAPDPPIYVETRTVIFLMALHRLSALVDSLVDPLKKWPKETPCAVIERATCPDQRVIRTTLEYVCAAIEEEGSRPPGLLVVGKSCEVLYSGKQKWVVEDGFKGLDGLDVEHKLLQDLTFNTPVAIST